MLTEALAGSLHCVLLWSSHLVYNSWRSSKTRGLCGYSASTPQRQSCLAYPASAFVGHGLKILLEKYSVGILYLYHTHRKPRFCFRVPLRISI